MDIEVEVRSFITEDKYKKLIEFMNKNAEFVNEDTQVTYYFSGDEDLRIQKNDYFSKIWLKKGKIHDGSREEIEIKFDKENFELLEKLFLNLGYNIDIKWFRKRHNFIWQEIKVAIDFTKGYGYIIELEKITKNEENKQYIYNELLNKMKELNIKITPKDVFDKKFNYYKKNWKKLI